MLDDVGWCWMMLDDVGCSGRWWLITFGPTCIYGSALALRDWRRVVERVEKNVRSELRSKVLDESRRAHQYRLHLRYSPENRWQIHGRSQILGPIWSFTCTDVSTNPKLTQIWTDRMVHHKLFSNVVSSSTDISHHVTSSHITYHVYIYIYIS